MDGEQISIQPEIWLDNEDEKVLRNNEKKVGVVGEVGLKRTKGKAADFDPAIRRFESSRPSQVSAKFGRSLGQFRRPSLVGQVSSAISLRQVRARRPP